MQTKHKRIGTMVLCAGLVFVMALPAWAGMLSRLQTVDDPELGELIRVALDNQRRYRSPDVEGVGAQDLKIVREVTESYARIRLLDRQIEQTERRVNQAGIPSELRQEMFLAVAELESKRMMELANLRQIMGIIPAHAFGRRPASQLRAWLCLDVLDAETVVVYAAQQPFTESIVRYSLIGAMSAAEAIDHVAGQLKQADRLPIRVDVERALAGMDLSHQIEKAVIALVQRVGLQMQAEVRLADSVRQRGSRFELFVWNDQVGTGTGRYDTGVEFLRNIIEPNDIPQHIERSLSYPRSLAVTIEIAYDPASETTVQALAQTIAETAERFGVARFVEVKRTLRPFDPGAKYVGRWVPESGPETVQLVILNNRTVQARASYEGGSHQTPGRWSLEGEQIVLIIDNDRVTGRIDESGNLILTPPGEEYLIFKKMND